jgi:hypothetical protein
VAAVRSAPGANAISQVRTAVRGFAQMISRRAALSREIIEEFGAAGPGTAVAKAVCRRGTHAAPGHNATAHRGRRRMYLVMERHSDVVAYRGDFAECQGFISLRREAGDSKAYDIHHYADVA